jgi:hypothetical protein
LGNNNGGMVAGYIFQDPLQKWELVVI